MSKILYKPVTNALVIALVGFLFQYVFNATLSSHFSQALYGDFSLTYNILYTLSPLVIWGGNVGVVRFVSSYLDKQRDHLAYHYLSWLFKVFALLSCVMLVLAALFIYVIYRYFYHSAFLVDHHVLVYSVWLLPIISITVLLAGMLTALNRPVLGTLTGGSVLKYSSLLIVLLLVIFFIQHTNALVLFFMLFSGVSLQLLCLAGLVLFTLYQRRLKWRQIWVSHPARPKTQGKWMSYGRTIMLQNIAISASSVVILTWLELVGHNESSVGHYAAFGVISGIIYALNMSLSMIMQSTIASQSSGGDMRKLQGSIGSVQAVSLFVNVALAATIIYFADFFLGHFGHEYLHLAPILKIYLVVQTASYFLMMSRPLCQLLGFSKLMFYVMFASILTLAIVGGVGVYFFGFEGAVAAVALVTLCGNLSTALVIYLKKGVSILPFGLFSRCGFDR